MWFNAKRSHLFCVDTSMALDINHYFKEKSPFRTSLLDEMLLVEYRNFSTTNQVKVWSPENFFVLVQQGHKTIHTSDKTYHLGPGQGIFLRRGAFSMSEMPGNDGSFQSLLMFCPDDFIRSFVLSYKDLFPKPDPVLARNQSVYQADKLAFEQSVSILGLSWGSPDRLQNTILKLRTYELLLRILSSAENEETLHSFLHTALTPNLRLREVMEQSFLTNLPLEAYARLSGMSLAKFKRDFRDEFGMSPGRWLKEERLKHAHLMLSQPYRSISEIAFDCGFENLSHFSRVFRERFGFSPSEVRSKETELKSL